MKNFCLSLIFLVLSFTASLAADISSLSWNQVCYGKMGEEWYSSDEAIRIADVLLATQRDNGGWMKNIEYHTLPQEEVDNLAAHKAERSCLDNYSTTQEMRYLARVYHKSGEARLGEAFNRALDMILVAEHPRGGWSQYWPLYNNGRYWDYVTFNDDLMANVMRLLQDITGNRNDFADITTAEKRVKCAEAFDRGLEYILDCQVDDNGTPSAWCAQHDPLTLLPVEGRPFELPSISGLESFNLLSFLMSIRNPSARVRQAVHSAIAWLDAHRIPGKALENYTNGFGEPDVRIVDNPESSLWGRFIQFGGESAKKYYDNFFEILKRRNYKRQCIYQGVTYTYTEYEIASNSYDPTKAYQPIYSIYENEQPHMFYRFLYNYEDTPTDFDWKGAPIETSLNARRRSSYHFLTNKGISVIGVEYPTWVQRIGQYEGSDSYDIYSLSTDTYLGSDRAGNTITYNFDGGVSVCNDKAKECYEGARGTSTIKYVRGVTYTIRLPEDMKVEKISFFGYDNYADPSAYLSSCNGTKYEPEEYVFPPRDTSGNPSITTHFIDFGDTPASGEIEFSLGGTQCALAINLFVKKDESGIDTVTCNEVECDGTVYTIDGRRVAPDQLRNGEIYISAGMKFLYHK